MENCRIPQPHFSNTAASSTICLAVHNGFVDALAFWCMIMLATNIMIAAAVLVFNKIRAEMNFFIVDLLIFKLKKYPGSSSLNHGHQQWTFQTPNILFSVHMDGWLAPNYHPIVGWGGGVLGGDESCHLPWRHLKHGTHLNFWGQTWK